MVHYHAWLDRLPIPELGEFEVKEVGEIAAT
jgi:hypothetical protein